MSTDFVETPSGAVRGAHERDVWAFKGIPYGADTAGDGRFRRARPPKPWPGVRDCLEYGPSCPQITSEQMLGIPILPESESMMGVLAYERVTSEDCLVLNVWTPSLDETAKLPVLVWLHGGGWSIGSASAPLYDFSNLSRHGGVVTVGINHRLGLLGFMDLSHLGEEFADSGNVGMLDVVSALEWVRDTITAFGGDPGNVTTFGESGGGAKTATLLAMPEGRGLFHKACVMSGALLHAQTPDRAFTKTESVLEHLGVGTEPEKLQALGADRLIEAWVALLGGSGNAPGRGEVFSPVIGPSLPDHPYESIRGGNASDVVVVVGCTTDEMLAFMFFDPDLWTLGFEDVSDRLRLLLGEDTPRIVSSYRAIRPDQSPTSLLVAISTDAKFRIPAIRVAEAKIEGGGAHVYMYAYAWGHPDPGGTVRAPHGLDMPFFFDNVDKAPIAAGPQAESLAKATSGALIALALTGDPSHAALPAWPAYTLDRRATLRFDVPSTVEDDPLGAERACWDDVALTGLGGT